MLSLVRERLTNAEIGQRLVASATTVRKHLYGPWTAKFSDGGYRIHNTRSGAVGTGTFTIVSGIFRARTITAVCNKSPSICAASVFRDRLTFTNEPGHQPCDWGTAPWVGVPR
jgi:hypothetical protein